jgi:hypothetical protein
VNEPFIAGHLRLAQDSKQPLNLDALDSKEANPVMGTLEERNAGSTSSKWMFEKFIGPNKRDLPVSPRNWANIPTGVVEYM